MASHLRAAFLILTVCAGCDPGASPEPSDDAGPTPDGRVIVPRVDAGPPPPPARCEEEGLRLPIHVTEPAQAERRWAPVSGGIPLARGALTDAALDGLALLDDEARPVRSFQRPVVLGRWNDGSVKWLLLDFMADVPAGATARFTLCSVAGHVPPEGIELEERDDAFVVDTGALRAEIPRGRGGLLGRVWLDANGDGAFDDDELAAPAPTELFIDLDDTPPGPRDEGVRDHPDVRSFGMEGGNWLRESRAETSTRYLASAGAREVTVFRRGATHTVLRVEGWHRSEAGRDFGRYTVYLHLHHGSSRIRLSHTWIMTGDPERDFVRRMGITMPTRGASRWAVGGAFEREGEPVTFVDGEPPYVPRTKGPSDVHQGALGGRVGVSSIGADRYYHDVPLDRDTRVPYRVRVDGEVLHEGFGASGWLDVSGTVGLAAGVRDFWREHPKEVAWAGGAMTVYLWPDDGDRALDLRRRYPEARGAASELGRAARREFDPVGSAVGLAKTTDVWLYFHPGDHASAAVDDVARGSDAPLRPFVSAAHNVATGVLGPMHARDETHARAERYLELTLAWPLRSAQEFGWHGWLDHGDHLIEYESSHWELDVSPNWGVYSNWGYAGWMQEAYRLGPALMVEYLRTGRDAYFREADVWLRHHRDVDCVHWDAPDDGERPGDNDGGVRLGGGHRHDQQHWGGYLAGYGIPTIATTHHYFSTGDGRDLDALRLYAEWILEHARIESHGRYSVLYMAEALGDPDLVARALSGDVTPGVGFGRLAYDSGMGLLLHDVQTNGAPEVRTRLRAWAAHDDEALAFVRAYLESIEGTGEHRAAIARDYAALFADGDVRARYFEWAPRAPTSFRDAFSPDLMPEGPWAWPIRSIEHLIFDAGRGLGNNPSRQVFVAQLPWLMPHVDE